MRALILKLILFAFSITFIGNQCEAAFQITLPSSWQKIQDIDDGAVYLNSVSGSRQVIIVRTVALGSGPHMTARELFKLEAEVQETRTGVLSSIGIREYATLEQAITNSVINVESSFLSLSGTRSQAVETAYFTPDQMFQMTYVEQSSAIADHERVRRLLDSVKPRIVRKTVFGELLLSDSKAAEIVAPSQISVLERVSTQSNQQAPLPDNCADLVKEPDRRRTPKDPPFVSAAGALAAVNGCFDASQEFGSGLAHGAWIGFRNLLPGYAPYKIVTSAWKYETDSAYKAEADAKALIVADVAMNPEAYATKIMSGIASFASTHIAQFPCLNTQAQVHIACQVGLNVASVLTLPGLTRLGMRGALAIGDSEKLAELLGRVMNVAVGKEAPLAKVAMHVAAKDGSELEVAPRAPMHPPAPGETLTGAQKQNADAAIAHAKIKIEADKAERVDKFKENENARREAALRLASQPAKPYRTVKVQDRYNGETVGKSAEGKSWRVKYLGDVEREKLRVTFGKDGRVYSSDGQLITNKNAIFVMGRDGGIYVSNKIEGTFHHSSFFASGEVAGAGQLRIEDGVIKAISRRSGHYLPSDEIELQVFEQLAREGVDIRQVETILPGK